MSVEQASPLTVNDYRISSEESTDLMSAEGSARAEVAQAIVDRLFREGAEISDVAAAELLDSAREAIATVAAYRKANDDPNAKRSNASNGTASKEKLDGQPLGHVEAFLRRFVAYPSEHACVAHVLWIAHTHMMEAWDSTPRIAFLSPEPGSGKSRALEATELLVPVPVEAVNVTPAYLFRKVGAQEGRPTILYDEIDTVFGPRAKENEEIRGLLNAGHRRHGVAGRCVVRGKQVFTEEIPAYCAVALAGLGGLPDTILSRCVIVRMRRRAPGEQVQSFRRRAEESQGHAIRDRLAKWASETAKSVTGVWPEMPQGIQDRDADVWESLLAIADAAGGPWPLRARAAAVALVADAKETTPSLGIRLLADMRHIFGGRESMSTDEIIKALCAIEEAPWSDLRGKPINDRSLASRLKPYQIHSKKLRQGDRTPRGYERVDLHDAWQRYLGPTHLDSGTSGTSATKADDVPDVPDVPHPMWGEPTAADAYRIAQDPG